MPEKPPTPDEKLQQEFNRWAAAGEGPEDGAATISTSPRKPFG